MEEEESSLIEIEVDPLTTNPGLKLEPIDHDQILEVRHDVGTDSCDEEPVKSSNEPESSSVKMLKDLREKEKLHIIEKRLVKKKKPSSAKGAMKGRVQCAACQLPFTSAISYKLHTCPQHISDNVFFCKLCNIVFNDLVRDVVKSLLRLGPGIMWV